MTFRLPSNAIRPAPVRRAAPRPSVRAALVLATAAGLVPGAASAQVNIERLRLGADSLGLAGALAVNLTLQSGNTEKRRADGQFRLDLLRASTQSFVIVSGDYDWTGGNRVSEAGLLHLRHIVRLQDRVQPELFGQVNYDRARLLDFRALAGAGFRVAVARGERRRASVGLALMAEREELDLPDGAAHPAGTTEARLSSFVTFSLEPREGVALAGTTYLQPLVDDPGDVRVLSQNRLAVTVLGPLSLNASFDLGYDAEPPDGLDTLDTSLRLGFGLRF